MRGFPMTKFLKVSVMLEKDAAYADARKWSDHQHHLTGKRVSYILSQAINSGLLVTTDEAARLYTQFNSQNFKVQDAGGAIRHLRQTLASEMQHLTYFEVTRDRAPFYSNPEPFGPKVAKKYHKASYDIEQASRCYALDRYTATVFHLMRAMEVSVRALARKLKVTFDPRTASWGEVLRLIDTAMKALPRATVKEQALKDKCAEAYTLLFHVKNVWRNETMHPSTFTLVVTRHPSEDRSAVLRGGIHARVAVGAHDVDPSTFIHSVRLDVALVRVWQRRQASAHAFAALPPIPIV